MMHQPTVEDVQNLLVPRFLGRPDTPEVREELHRALVALFNPFEHPETSSPYRADFRTVTKWLSEFRNVPVTEDVKACIRDVLEKNLPLGMKVELHHPANEGRILDWSVGMVSSKPNIYGLWLQCEHCMNNNKYCLEPK